MKEFSYLRIGREIMEVGLNIFCDLLHIQKFAIICNFFLALNKKKRAYSKEIVFIVTMLVSFFGQVFFVNAIERTLIYIIFLFELYCYLYEEKKKKLFLLSIWSEFLVAFLDEISKVIVLTICTILKLKNSIFGGVGIQIITLLVLLTIGCGIRNKYKTGIKDMGIGYYIGITILFFGDTVILVYLSDYAIDKIKADNKVLYQLAFLMVSFGILAQIAMVIFLAVSRNVYRENEQLASQYLNEQKKYYEYLETRERKTKKFRHDLRSHMFIINALNKKKDYDKLEEYLDKMNGQIETFGNVICVNNGIVDAILNKFYDEAERSGIKVEVIGHFPSDCNISAFDLCTIFSNLLRNAMEAEQESKKSVIKVSCGYTKDMIVLSIENDSVGKKVEIDGKIETSKQDKWNHGFGLENVQECVKRNQGELLIESEQNRFKVMVLLARVEQL